MITESLHSCYGLASQAQASSVLPGEGPAAPGGLQRRMLCVSVTPTPRELSLWLGAVSLTVDSMCC